MYGGIVLESQTTPKRFRIPQNGATVTVFAPYDCRNACPFCINKEDYQNHEDYDFDLENVIESINLMDGITPDCDFVITGGEPLASHSMLKKILDAILHQNNAGSNHRLFINTSSPYDIGDVEFLNSFQGLITEINVSRHISSFFEEGDDGLIGELVSSVRINCVILSKDEASEIGEFLERFDFDNVSGIQFRDDYVGVNWDNLYNLRENEIFLAVARQLSGHDVTFPEQYLESVESFRWNARFDTGDKPVWFHRTMHRSKLENDECIEINDIIIRPNGIIVDDWNEHGDKLDIERYKDAINDFSIDSNPKD